MSPATGGGWDTGKVPLLLCPDPAAHVGDIERRPSREFEATEFVSFAVAYLEAVLGRDHPTVVAGHSMMEKMLYGPMDAWRTEVERAMETDFHGKPDE